MNRYSTLGLALALAVSLGTSLPASAQRDARTLSRLTEQAMEAYNNLELDQARDMLEEGIREAESNEVGGEELAQAYLSLGVVYAGGLNDEQAALGMFESGLRADANVELDPVVSTPEISALFDKARARAFQAAPRAAAGGTVQGNLNHTAVTEQLSQTGVPVYVEAADGMEVATMRVFYRSLGMREPASADMRRHDDGWGFLVPCTDVYEPTVEYFIVAIDADGQQVGNVGTPREPVVVPIVTSRTTDAPSLPGQPAPSQCGGKECPPGMAGCSGSGGLGDTCRSQADCGDGLFCSDNFCSLHDDGADEKKNDGEAPRLFARFGFGLGLAVVKSGMAAAGAPGDPYFEDRAPVIPGMPTMAEQKGLAERAAEANYECNFESGSAEDCKVLLEKNGLAPTAAFRFELGGFVTERVSLSVVGRIQLNSGGGTLGGILLGGRVGYLLTEPRPTGFQPSIFGGFTVGQIQPQPKPAELPPGLPLDDGSVYYVDSPHIASGLFGLHAGAHLGYRFVRNFGIYVAPELDLQLGNTLFNMELMAGVEVAY